MLHAPTICVRCKLYMHVAFSNAHSYEHTCYSLRPALKSRGRIVLSNSLLPHVFETYPRLTGISLKLHRFSGKKKGLLFPILFHVRSFFMKMNLCFEK